MRNVQIDVLAEDDPQEDCGVRFSNEWRFQDSPGQAHKGRIDLPARETYVLRFHLRDESSRNLKFSPPGVNAMWVTSGSDNAPPECPSNAGDGGQIKFSGPQTGCSKNLLAVINANSGDPCLLKYALRFDGDPHKSESGQQYPPYVFDPEIKNGGSN